LADRQLRRSPSLSRYPVSFLSHFVNCARILCGAYVHCRRILSAFHLWLFTSFLDVLFLFCLLLGDAIPAASSISPASYADYFSVHFSGIVCRFFKKIQFYLHMSKFCCTFAADYQWIIRLRHRSAHVLLLTSQLL
jgi:hypothetical protein